MTVKKLIKLLQKEDPNRIVVMASDSEGNSYSELNSFWTGKYRFDGYEGEVGMDKLTPEDIENGYTEEDVMKGGKPALILVP